MNTYDRNRNAIATGSMVMVADSGATGVIKAIHAEGKTAEQLLPGGLCGNRRTSGVILPAKPYSPGL